VTIGAAIDLRVRRLRPTAMAALAGEGRQAHAMLRPHQRVQGPLALILDKRQFALGPFIGTAERTS
jgi:hypothetical protein